MLKFSTATSANRSCEPVVAEDMRVKNFSSFTASEEIGTCTLRVTILLLTTLGYCFQSLESYASYFLMQLITKEPIYVK